ncbi:ABC transporter permease [Inquilinus sp. CA228]|uniref:ABC transporter permease n=1 Tax=Inquilinus sp. CA228 TaxID=3455609 RepID=UPI003F8CF963
MVRLFAHRGFALGLALCVVFIGMALLSLAWTPFPPNAIAIPQKLQAPGALHWLGTDQLGRDTLSRIMVGARTSVAVGVVAVVIGLVLGVPLGLWAAARRGWTDEILGRAVDLTFAFPAILSAILITALLGPGAVNAILAIGIFNIAVFARVARGAALVVYGRDFVRAAQSLGRSRLDIALRHVLPNMANALIVQATIQFAIAILAEAALGYLGLGTQPPQASWGKMLLDAQTLLAQAPLQAVFPGLAIAVAVLGLNLIGDGLRDLLDPRMKVGRIG